MKVQSFGVDENLDLLQQEISALLKVLHEAKTLNDKIKVLSQQPRVALQLKNFVSFSSFLSNLSPICHYVAKAVIAIGQENLFRFSKIKHSICVTHWKNLIDELVAIEHFYQPIGGIIGYQNLVLELLSKKTRHEQAAFASLHPPARIDLTRDSLEIRKSIIDGIKAQGELAEVYPAGGAADRLQLVDEETQEKLPAARLVFLGNHLLEGVIRDLQAREYLSFRLFGRASDYTEL